MKTVLAAINARYIHTSLSVRCLRQYARQAAGLDISVSEFTINQTVGEILPEIMKQSPDVIGFSCYLWNISMIRKLTALIKEISHQTKIIWGGPEVSPRPEDEFSSPVDFIIRGEGERSFTELIKALESGSDLSAVHGISYIKNGNVIHNPLGKPLDLSEIPFPYEESDRSENKIFYYEASRGCPFNCQYCLSSLEKGVRFAPLSKVKEDLSVFLSWRVRQVKFVDRTFNCKPEFATEIIRFLIANDNGATNFHFEVAAELLTEEINSLLRSARKGLFQLEIGVQSTNPETLSAVKRRTELPLIKKQVDELKGNNNLRLHLDLIAGLPAEDYKTFQKSFNDVYSLYPHQLQLGFLKVLRGSGMEDLCEKYGIHFSPFPPYEVLFTDCLSFSELQLLKGVEEMLELFYNSGKFQNTIRLLSKNFPSPFDFYKALSDFLPEVRYEVLGSRRNAYRFLLDFAEKHGLQSNKLPYILKFDMLLHEGMKTNPPWLGISQSAEDSEKLYSVFQNADKIKSLFPEYADCHPKQLPKLIHGEVFHFDPMTMEKKEAVLLFNYRRRDLYGNADFIRWSD